MCVCGDCHRGDLGFTRRFFGAGGWDVWIGDRLCGPVRGCAVKIYLSARYGRAEEMRQIARTLRAAGHEITSRWIYPTCQDASYPDHPRAGQWAAEDLADVAVSDLLVHFAEVAGAPGADSGGRLVELGYALGIGIPCVVIGSGDCIFYRLPQVRRFADVAYIRHRHFARAGLPVQPRPETPLPCARRGRCFR